MGFAINELMEVDFAECGVSVEEVGRIELSLFYFNDFIDEEFLGLLMSGQNISNE